MAGMTEQLRAYAPHWIALMSLKQRHVQVKHIRKVTRRYLVVSHIRRSLSAIPKVQALNYHGSGR